MTLTVQNDFAQIFLDVDWRKLEKILICWRVYTQCQLNCTLSVLGSHQIWTVTSIVIISSLTKELILYFYPFGLSIYRLISILVAESWFIWGEWFSQDGHFLSLKIWGLLQIICFSASWSDHFAVWSVTIHYYKIFKCEVNLTHSKGIKWAITSSKKDLNIGRNPSHSRFFSIFGQGPVN